MGGDGGRDINLTRDESDLLQEQLLPSLKEWQAGELRVYFPLATTCFCTFSGSASFTRVLKLLLGGGGCFWSVDVMLEMLLKPTDFLRAANSCCPWRSCPLSARLYLPSNLA